ncbi:MAG: hypothetical protein DWQ05_17920 [Calditrichaeota bacterium]|nr:MAG: hypothetical protein DWQ05_17920 [Calditrichota bacterium]
MNSAQRVNRKKTAHPNYPIPMQKMQTSVRNIPCCTSIAAFIQILTITIFLFILPCKPVAAEEFSKIIVQTGDMASPVEKNVAHLLVERLTEAGIKILSIETESSRKNIAADELLILLGTTKSHTKIARQIKINRIQSLTDRAPGPEGFLLKMLFTAEHPTLLAAGVDDRGCLYAVGEILRQFPVIDGAIEIPQNFAVRTAPAFEIRGTQFGQSHVAKRLAHVRDWTKKETQRVILDYALAGANIFNCRPGPMFDFIKSFGLMTQGGFGANTSGREILAEWHASESIGRLGYVCLSIPEAAEFMLRKCEQQFKDSPTYDLVKFHGGDGGGCECDKCNPYGLKFIKIVEKMAAIIHKYHPESRIYFTNQKFDNEDDNAIFSYLQEKPRVWLWAWGYGPGSDAASWQPGHRQTHRMDLFRYPGFGPYGLYPKEILHQLPKRHDLVYYNEITHWKYAQHAYIQMYPRADRNGDLPPHWSHDIYERRPDQFLTMVYNRLTFFAWPKYYHRVFNDLMPYGVGDITHSSGHHDHFNQWMWQRLLWSPRKPVHEVVDEYCTTWFGRPAAPAMAEAIFQLESNLQEIPDTPLTEKKGIDTYYKLVKKAGDLMPVSRRKNNWLWRMYMQKAALDKYVQLAVKQQLLLQQRIEENTSAVLQESDKNDKIDVMLTWFDAEKETLEMKHLRDEAGRLGEESNALFGVRSEGYFNLDHDFIGLGWLRRQLERAKQAKGREKLELLNMIIDYENPGEGGFYDNLGTFNPAPNVVSGYPYDHGQPYVGKMLSEHNRPSQRSMHFTQDEERGVTFRYENLDPQATYRVRFTLVRPWYQARYADRMNQKSQKIYADDIILAENLELPLQMSDFFHFDIPAAATRDGKLIIRLEKAADVARGDQVKIEQWRNSGGWGTLISEIWLMKKED